MMMVRLDSDHAAHGKHTCGAVLMEICAWQHAWSFVVTQVPGLGCAPLGAHNSNFAKCKRWQTTATTARDN